MTFRDTRYQQLVARPGQPIDPANATDRLRLARAFAAALDALVLGQQSGQATVEGLVARATDAARVVTDQSLHVEANGITLDGELLLPAMPDSGAWILQAWYAGLRGLTPLADLRAEDVRVLATGLAQAKPGPEAVDALASWLWSSPTDGFRLDLRVAAGERIEAVFGDLNTARVSLRAGWLDAANKALQSETQRGPRSAAAQEREQAWWTRTSSGELALSEADAIALRQEAEEPAALLRTELMVALADASWQAVSPPPLVARQLVRIAARTFDADLASLTSLLSADEADWGRICVAELNHFPLGDALAAAAPLQPAYAQEQLHALQALFNRLPETTGVSLMQGLLARLAAQPDPYLTAFGQLAQQLGLEVFLRLASPSSLAASTRTLVGKILLSAAPSPEEWTAVCAGLPMAAFIEVLRSTPPDAMQPLIAAMAAVVKKADPRERSQLVLWLTDANRQPASPPEAIDALADALIATAGAGWEARTVRRLADAALRLALRGAEFLDLMRNAKVPPDVRVQLLEALARAPEFAEEALKWRMGEMFDVPELRDRLVDLRKRRTM